MAEKIISFAGQSLTISFPEQAADIVNFTFLNFPEGNRSSSRVDINVSCDKEKQLYSVLEDEKCIGTELSPVGLSLLLLSRSSYSLTHGIDGGMVIHGAAVHRNNRAILMPGKNGTGKSILTSWLISRGYSYLTDELVYFQNKSLSFSPLTGPLHIKESGRHILEGFCSLHNERNNCLQSDTTTLFSHRLFDKTPISPSPELSCLLFIEQHNNSTLAVKSISPAQAAKRLMESLANAEYIGLHSVTHPAALSKKIPAIVLQYGDLEHLESVLEPIIDLVLESNCRPSSFQQFIQAFQTVSTPPPRLRKP